MCAVAEELRGGPAELAAKPYFTMYLEPVSPLSHPVESIDKLLFCADHGIPAIYSPAPLAGGTAPITVAGHTCQGGGAKECNLTQERGQHFKRLGHFLILSE